MQTSVEAENKHFNLKNSGRCRMIVSVLMLVILCQTCAKATTDASNNTGFSGKQMLTMGLDKFIRLYSSHHHYKPDEAACLIYCDYKKIDNQQRIARLSTLNRRLVKQLYAALQNWEETALHLRLDWTGGGTAWINDKVTEPAYFEECLGQVIACYEPPQHPRRITKPPVHALRGGYLLLKHCETLLAQDQVNRADDFRRTLPLFRKQVATLRKTLALQSPSVQYLIAKHLNEYAHLM